MENTERLPGSQWGHFSPVSPKLVFKEAFAAQIIHDGQLWIDMLGTRNDLAHRYDEAIFEEAIHQMADRYLNGFEELYTFFEHRIKL